MQQPGASVMRMIESGTQVNEQQIMWSGPTAVKPSVDPIYFVNTVPGALFLHKEL